MNYNHMVRSTASATRNLPLHPRKADGDGENLPRAATSSPSCAPSARGRWGRRLLKFGLLILLLSSPQSAWAQSTAHLTFWEAADVSDVVGPISFGAEKLQPLALSGWPGGHFGTAIERDANSVWAYSWSIGNWENSSQRQFVIRRASTSNGKNFSNTQTVFTQVQPGAQGFANIVHRPTDNRLFAFSWESGNMRVWRSDANGANWQDLGIAYSGHDAMNIIWHPGIGKFLNYQTHLKPWPEKDPDDNLANLRRVLQFRTSDDGVHWQNVSPEFLGGAPFWEPDGMDHPDLEFYRVATFPHLGRYAMLLLDYTADPNTPGQHSQVRVGTEWAISRDGLNWSRPFREINAEELLDWTPVQGPLAIGDKLRFNHHADGAELPHDRIFHVASADQAQFVSKPFAMPKGGLFLNADVDQGVNSRIEAELLDVNGNVIPGYERANSVVADQDGHAIALSWNGNASGPFAGLATRVRFHLRDAKIFGVSYQEPAAPSPRKPLGYWRGEESGGTTAIDWAAPQHHGELRGTASRSVFVPTSVVSLYQQPNSQSLRFDGNPGEAVDMVDVAELDVGSGSFTLEAWIHAESADLVGMFIAGKRISGLFSDIGYELLARQAEGGFTVEMALRAGGSSGYPQAVSQVLSAGQWHHLAGVRDTASGRVKLYVDGSLAADVADTTAGVTLNSLQHFSIGGAIQGDGMFQLPFDGWIDEVRLTMSAIEPSQFLSAPLPLIGDLNGDGYVGQDDLNIVLGNWGQNVPPGNRLLGDSSGDGFVGQNDLNHVLGDWGQEATGGLAAIPEPAGFLTASIGSLALVWKSVVHSLRRVLSRLRSERTELGCVRAPRDTTSEV